MQLLLLGCAAPAAAAAAAAAPCPPCQRCFQPCPVPGPRPPCPRPACLPALLVGLLQSRRTTSLPHAHPFPHPDPFTLCPVLCTPAEEYAQSFRPFLMDVIYAWSKGASFGEVCGMTTIMEGSIIRWVAASWRSSGDAVGAWLGWVVVAGGGGWGVGCHRPHHAAESCPPCLRAARPAPRSATRRLDELMQQLERAAAVVGDKLLAGEARVGVEGGEGAAGGRRSCPRPPDLTQPCRWWRCPTPRRQVCCGARRHQAWPDVCGLHLPVTWDGPTPTEPQRRQWRQRRQRPHTAAAGGGAASFLPAVRIGRLLARGPMR